MKAMRDSKYTPVAAAVISICAFLFLWKWAIAATSLGKLLPGPDTVLTAMWAAITGTIGKHSVQMHALYSLKRVMVGYVIASATGILLGLSMGWSKTIAAIFQPIFIVLRPIPPIAWIPISIIWFGLGEESKYFMIFLAAFANVTLNAWAGARAVDPEMVGAAKVMGANRWQVFSTVVAPCAIPQIFAGLQLGLSSSWAAVLAAEMVRSSEGCGWMIITGMDNNNISQILVGIVTIGVIGFMLAVSMRKLEDVLCRWNKSGR